MISHEHKCIFIHVPRTAGSSIEKALCGNDWWLIDPNTKHVKASTARSLYERFWNTYLVFTVFRTDRDRNKSFERAFGIADSLPFDHWIDIPVDRIISFYNLQNEWRQLPFGNIPLPHIGNTQ